MAEFSIDKVIQDAKKILSSLDFDLLILDEETSSTPYSRINPGFQYYIIGKLLNDPKWFRDSVELLENLCQRALNSQEYAIAAEFLILKIKSDANLESKRINKSYKKALKIYNNLSNLDDKDPYFIHSIIDLEVLYSKISGISTKDDYMDELFRKAADRYYIQANKYDNEYMNDLKIISLMEALKFFDKIKSGLTDAELRKKRSLIQFYMKLITRK